jgi:hypothetical protein
MIDGAMKTSRSRVAALVLCGMTGLAGCAGGIHVDRQSADEITLYWYGGSASIEDANSRASEHCATLRRRATLVREFADDDVTTAMFACQP